jgi:hypothetical protein
MLASLETGLRSQPTSVGSLKIGSLADSWRHQPGQPAYCSELNFAESGQALAAAERTEASKRRDLIAERIRASGRLASEDEIIMLNRTLTR